MTNLNLLNQFDRIQKILEGRNYPQTILQLVSSGGIKKFPYPQLKRFVVPTQDYYEWAAYCGCLIAKETRVGQSTIQFDALPELDEKIVFRISEQNYIADYISNNLGTFPLPLDAAFPLEKEAIIKGYQIRAEGDYPRGTRQLIVLTHQPIICGDQWISGLQRTTVLAANKTQNPLQWDVLLQEPLDTVIVDGQQILVQASAAVYWESLPVEIGPCWLTLPNITHLQTSGAIPLAFVRFKAGNTILRTIITQSPMIQIANAGITADSWSTAHITKGHADYFNGVAKLVPGTEGFVGRLNFLDSLNGSDIQTWLLNIRAEIAGKLIIRTNTSEKSFELIQGLQQLRFDVAALAINWIEIYSDVKVYLGEITASLQISNVDVAIHLFNQEYLGSHIFGRPTLNSIVKSAAVTWARNGETQANAGFKVKPLSRFREPVTEIPESTVSILSPLSNASYMAPVTVLFKALALTRSPFNGPYTYTWLFADRTTVEGRIIEKSFTALNAGYQSATVVALNKSTGKTCQATVYFTIEAAPSQVLMYHYLGGPFYVYLGIPQPQLGGEE